MPNERQLIDGTLPGYPPPTLALMKEAFGKGWSLVSHRYQGVEATAEARLRFAAAIVAVTPQDATSADDVARMAIDLMTIEERDLKRH
jgi:hypothetical protein